MAVVRSLISMVTPASHGARLAGVKSLMRYFHGNVIDPNHRLASRRPLQCTNISACNNVTINSLHI